MQYRSVSWRAALCVLALTYASCAARVDDPDVTYGAELPVPDVGGRAGGTSGANGAGTGAAESGGSAAAGHGGAHSIAAAGSGGGESTSAVAGGATQSSGPSSVVFDVTTVSQGGRYSPKNIGAIWVQSSAGTFVKSLELWAKQRRTHLSKFNAAVGSTGAVDVTASATLSTHRAHHVTWSLKDRSGATVPPGKYTLFIEVTDYDGPGKWYSLDFDTSTGARTTPAGSPYYQSMALSIE
jgi:hypothetical protein